VNRWTGTIAYIGRETVDGRILDRLDPGGLPAPLIADTESQEPIGRIDEIDQRADGTVYGQGVVDLPAGRYGIAVNLTGSQTVDELPGDAFLIRVAGELAAAMILDEGMSAWPDAVITVEEES
jgi:hypothetical protein